MRKCRQCPANVILDLLISVQPNKNRNCIAGPRVPQGGRHGLRREHFPSPRPTQNKRPAFHLVEAARLKTNPSNYVGLDRVAPYQKTYLSANWITRGLTLVEVIQPPVGVLMFGNEAKVPGAIGAA